MKYTCYELVNNLPRDYLWRQGLVEERTISNITQIVFNQQTMSQA